MKKLNERGIAHWIAPLLVVAAISIIGVIVLKGSHADSPAAPITAETTVESTAKTFGVPKIVNANEQAYDRIALGWEFLSVPNGPSVQYYNVYAYTQGDAPSTAKLRARHVTVQYYPIGHLKPLTTYNFYIKAYSNTKPILVSPPSAIFQASTTAKPN